MTPVVFAAAAFAGLVALFFHRLSDLRWWATRVVIAIHLLGALYILKMTWSRYVLYAAPVFALLVAAGVAFAASRAPRSEVPPH